MSTGKFIDPLEAIIAQLQDDTPPRGWEVIHQLHSFPSAQEMAFRSSQKSRLRPPMLRARAGLKLEKTEQRLVVDYDYESADLRILRMRIAFYDVLAIGYREIALHADSDFKGAREVRCNSQSAWLSEVLSTWQSSLPRPNGHNRAWLGRGLKHYTVFSLSGRVDVVAASCRMV